MATRRSFWQDPGHIVVAACMVLAITPFVNGARLLYRGFVTQPDQIRELRAHGQSFSVLIESCESPELPGSPRDCRGTFTLSGRRYTVTVQDVPTRPANGSSLLGSVDPAHPTVVYAAADTIPGFPVSGLTATTYLGAALMLVAAMLVVYPWRIARLIRRGWRGRRRRSPHPVPPISPATPLPPVPPLPSEPPVT